MLRAPARTPSSPMNPLTSALLTDLYQLTMLQVYFDRGMTATAVFELFVRKHPARTALSRRGRSCAGARVRRRVLRLRRRGARLDRALGDLPPAGFAERLARLRFTGAIEAMPEGTVFYPNEPIVRVVAPLPEAQLLQTRRLNLVHFQTLVATKAAHLRLAAPGKRLIDFGLRRAHGAEAGLLAARASYLAGFDGTATALAGPLFGIPVFGTMAHSFVQAHDYRGRGGGAAPPRGVSRARGDADRYLRHGGRRARGARRLSGPEGRAPR
ncbi:MAG: hypothetical protein RML56_05575 [Burkholderiales bacterium]|nr:hypothetical protein [Burkholderiales bacterium]